MDADTTSSARVIEVCYETNRAIVRFEGRAPDLGVEAVFLPASTAEPLARVNDEGFIVECGDLPLSPGMLLYAAAPAQAACLHGIDRAIRRCKQCEQATNPVAVVVAVYPPGPDGHGVNWLKGKRPRPGDLLYAAPQAAADVMGVLARIVNVLENCPDELSGALFAELKEARRALAAGAVQAEHPLDALLPEICQLIDTVKVEWQQQGCWSEWDQSVRDRIAAYNIAKMKGASAGADAAGAVPEGSFDAGIAAASALIECAAANTSSPGFSDAFEDLAGMVRDLSPATATRWRSMSEMYELGRAQGTKDAGRQSPAKGE